MAKEIITAILTAAFYLIMIILIVIFSGGDATFIYEGF